MKTLLRSLSLLVPILQCFLQLNLFLHCNKLECLPLSVTSTLVLADKVEVYQPLTGLNRFSG
jgi:hypothetical protein